MNTKQRRRSSIPRALLLSIAMVGTACQGLAGPSAPAVSDAPIETAAPTALPTPPGLEIVGGAFTAPVAACAGPAPWTGVPAIVVRLAEAWHEHHGGVRRGILDEVWGPDSVYQDPYDTQVIGPGAFADVMSYGVAPGQYIELRSWDPADMHHGAIRMAWRHCCPSGLSILEGTDIAWVGNDGRFSRIVSFWERYVEEPAEGACDGPRASAAPSVPPATATATTCRGADVDWSGLPSVGQGYAKAWNERDPAARAALLEEVWADDGTFADLYVGTPVVGREAFSREIDGFLTAGFGAYFEPRPIVEADFHHWFLRMPWTYCDADDKVVWVGEDIAQLDTDNRITAVLSFFIP